MRISTPASSRLEWYDRNAVSSVQVANTGSVAPHTSVIRISYTVPAGRKAIVELINHLVERNTAATVAADANCQLLLTPAGGAQSAILLTQMNNNGVGAQQNTAASPLLAIYSADKLVSADADSSTGGTLEFQHSFKVSEYDA